MEEEPWYFGICSRDEASKYLQEDGDYFVRYSSNVKGYVLSCQWKDEQYNFKFKERKIKVLYTNRNKAKSFIILYQFEKMDLHI